MHHDTRIKNHISEIAKDNRLNQFITISFTGENYSHPLWKDDVSRTEGLIRLYARKLTEEVFGRSRETGRMQDKWIPVIAIPEYRKSNGDRTFLHYHLLTRFPEGCAMKLTFFTRKFWREFSKKHLQCVPDTRVKYTNNTLASAFYSMKNIEFGFTVENIVAIGIRL